MSPRLEMQDYSPEKFLPHVGREFRFQDPAPGSGAVLRFKLLAVERPKHSTAAGFREPFALLFALIDGTPTARGLHRIVHEHFEPAGWLLSRVTVPGGDPQIAYYEAVFG